MCSKTSTCASTGSFSDSARALKEALAQAEAVVVGAGAGLSTSAGFVYTGARFERYFADFAAAYGIRDMYAGGFYPYATPEEHWAYWSRYIYVNRYMDPPRPVYDRLLELVRNKDYFVLTTNVDHCFQRAGFAKERLFYTQGDYGLWQCSEPCCQETFDNRAAVRAMVEAQGFAVGENGALELPEGARPLMSVPGEFVPRCPHCGRPLSMNLRADATFVEDAGWHEAAARYTAFVRGRRERRTLFLELGVGHNTPGIIKYNFWQMACDWPQATYACVNFGEAYAPRELEGTSICLNADIGDVLAVL
jgi:NAD-dependent SIR2 family protein deacetylase